MKILAAKFVLEANAHVPMKCDMENVALSYGKEALSHMQLGNVFDVGYRSHPGNLCGCRMQRSDENILFYVY